MKYSNIINKTSFFGLCTLAFFNTGCKPKFKATTPEKGMVNAERVVYIGGSSMAGYADGALTAEGQNNSVASLLSLQLKAIGASDIVNPMVNENSVGVDITGTKSVFKLDYKADCNGVSALSPVRVAASGDASIFASVYNSSTKFTNIGVPFMTATALNLPNYATLNPFFGRFTSSASTTVTQNAVASDPTFFTMMVGEEDILAYALKGGGTATLTSQAQFEGSVQATVNALTVNGAKGVIVNIPDVTTYPIFNTIAWNGLVLDEAKLASLPPIFTQLFDLKVGNNAFIIDDNGDFRQMKEGEKVIFTITGDSLKCFPKYGSQTPMANRHVLTLAEIAQIKSATNGYNASLESVAMSKGLAYADVNSILAKLPLGYPQNGITMTNKFVSGGAFSLDGFTMTPRGNAVIANIIIKSINSKFGASINTLDVSKYRAVKFP